MSARSGGSRGGDKGEPSSCGCGRPVCVCSMPRVGVRARVAARVVHAAAASGVRHLSRLATAALLHPQGKRAASGFPKLAAAAPLAKRDGCVRQRRPPAR